QTFFCQSEAELARAIECESCSKNRYESEVYSRLDARRATPYASVPQPTACRAVASAQLLLVARLARPGRSLCPSQLSMIARQHTPAPGHGRRAPHQLL